MGKTKKNVADLMWWTPQPCQPRHIGGNILKKIPQLAAPRALAAAAEAVLQAIYYKMISKLWFLSPDLWRRRLLAEIAARWCYVLPIKI